MRSSKIIVGMLLAAWASLAHAYDLIGQASVIDGDTLEIHGTRIRLFGIDAPEGGQLCMDAQRRPYRCGQQAANALADYLVGRPVTCAAKNTDQYGRIVATCTVSNGDLGDWLVRRGFAVDYVYYSKGKYREAAARTAHSGIWAGSFVEPKRFRDCMKGLGQIAACSVP